MGRFLLENTPSTPRLSLYRLGPTPLCTLSEEGGLESLPQRALMAVPRSIHYLERESYVDGNRASDCAQAQKSARFTATNKKTLTVLESCAAARAPRDMGSTSPQAAPGTLTPSQATAVSHLTLRQEMTSWPQGLVRRGRNVEPSQAVR